MEDALTRLEKLQQKIKDSLAKSNDTYASLDALNAAIEDQARSGLSLSQSTKSIQKLLQKRKKMIEQEALREAGVDITGMKDLEKFSREKEAAINELSKLWKDRLDMIRRVGNHPNNRNLKKLNTQIGVMMDVVHQYEGAEQQQASNMLETRSWKDWVGSLDLGTKAMAALEYQVLRTIESLKSAGLSYRQIPEQFINSIIGFFKDLPHGLFLSPAVQAQLKGQFARNQLTTNMDENARLPAAQLANMGVSVDSAQKLSYQLYRISGYSADSSKSWVQTVRSLEEANHIPNNILFEKMAQDMDLLANAANRVPGALAAAEVNASRLGISLRSVEGLADKLTGNFEDYLDAQARLQTVLPGTDLTQVMIASQYGSTNDVLNALRGALGNRDIGNLPRSIRQMISQSFGLSQEELVNIGKGVKPEDQFKYQQTSISLWTDMKESLGRIAVTLTELVVGLMALKTGTQIAKGVIGSGGVNKLIGSSALFGGGNALLKGGFGQFSSIAGRLGTGLAIGGGALGGFEAVSDFASTVKQGHSAGHALLRNLGALVGLGAGVALALPTGGLSLLTMGGAGLGIGSLVDTLITHNLLPNDATRNNGDVTVAPQTNAVASVQLSDDDRNIQSQNFELLAAKMDELIRVIRAGGFTVNMDGQKVGEVVQQAFARGNRTPAVL